MIGREVLMQELEAHRLADTLARTIIAHNLNGCWIERSY
mgnify:CR=1 FL=1